MRTAPFDRYFRVAVICLVLLIISAAGSGLSDARPGGGQSYSHGDSSYDGGSSSGGGGSDGLCFVIEIVFQIANLLPPPYNVIFLLLMLCAAAAAFFVRGYGVVRPYISTRTPDKWEREMSRDERKRINDHYRDRAMRNSTTTTGGDAPEGAGGLGRASVITSGTDKGDAVRRVMRRDVDTIVTKLQEADPDFSRILFLEFIYSLYVKLYSMAGKKEARNITPFFSDLTVSVDRYSDSVAREITDIVVGSISLAGMQEDSETQLLVEIEANYTLSIHGKLTRYAVSERWLVARLKGIVTKTTSIEDNISCPNCGAPTDFTDAGVCLYCKTIINRGTMQWYVKDRVVTRQEQYGADSLFTYAYDTGLKLPTIIQANLSAATGDFANTHKTSWLDYWKGFQENVVTSCFVALYDAWTRQKLSKVRHLLADRLLDSYSILLKEYERANAVNRLEGCFIRQMDIARVDRDKYYESITVRLFASCFDYCVDREGKVIAGSNTVRRSFSEYWTFIRRQGVNADSLQVRNCPHCGAPIDKMGQSAICGYCSAKVSTGEYSWVLVMIVQDEVYRG